MVGDVNLFVDNSEKSAEVEVMIAEPSARRLGVASEAVSILIAYGSENLKIKDFFARITDDNEASLALFEKKLNFEKESHSEVFGEWQLRLPAAELSNLCTALRSVQQLPYR